MCLEEGKIGNENLKEGFSFGVLRSSHGESGKRREEVAIDEERHAADKKCLFLS